jgi:hypothetical protein
VIEARGFLVLRFSNHDVRTNRVGVLQTIAAALAERAPTLTLPRKRRAIAYGSCACAVASREQSAPKAASKRSLFDSGLFSIRFCCAGASDTRQRRPSRGWDSKISICDTPARKRERGQEKQGS